MQLAGEVPSGTMYVSTWRHRRTLMLDFGLDEGPLNSQKHMWAHHEENFRSANIQGLKLSAGANTKGSRIGKCHLHHASKTPGRENVIAQLVGLPNPLPAVPRGGLSETAPKKGWKKV